ncbi:hypothetical protein PUN28_011760 [Cardiocondyla obscurior]|uniref:Uncharacterized protein n=1 Tax=Cardiocondyla obscurior TaxID=286306 RepID=A0AAW2FHJ4_9HYME
MSRARAPFRELISHGRAKAGPEHPPSHAILLNYDSPQRGGTNVSCVPAIFLSPLARGARNCIAPFGGFGSRWRRLPENPPRYPRQRNSLPTRGARVRTR